MEQQITKPAKGKQGFASMDADKLREIARKGGQSVPAEKRTFSRDPEFAARAGRVGGQSVDPANRSFTKDHALASAAGRKGGRATHHGRAAQ